MTGSQPRPDRSRIWTRILREIEADGQPVRSEGLDFVEATDLGQFVEVGWGELLFVCDFLLQILVRVSEDTEFVRAWQAHSGVVGDGELMLLERATEVSTQWLRRLEHVAEHHRAAGTEPSAESRIPRALYRTDEPLEVLMGETVGKDAKFGLLQALTRLVIAHASIARARTLARPEELPDTAQEGASWIHSISESVMTAGRHAAPALFALNPATFAKVERLRSDVLSRYEVELVEELRSRHGSDPGERSVVVVDAQLASDLAVLEIAGALGTAWRSGREMDWRAFGRWRSEGRRILDGSSRPPEGLGRLDLSEATSWFEPNFGATWPSCIADAEDLARLLVAAMTARSSWVGGGVGDLIDVITPSHSVRFRIAGAAAHPWTRGSLTEAASHKNPLLMWLLFPSTGSSTLRCFWRQGAYGAFASALEEVASPREDRRAYLGGGGPGRSHDVAQALFPKLAPSGIRAVAAFMAPLLVRWREWGQVDGDSSDLRAAP